MGVAVGDTELCVILSAMLVGAKYCRLPPLDSGTVCNVYGVQLTSQCGCDGS
jgi:hypothetical protein